MFTAPQQADIENKKVLESLRAETPDKANVPAGSRVVSGEQWSKLQEEVQVHQYQSNCLYNVFAYQCHLYHTKIFLPYAHLDMDVADVSPDFIYLFQNISAYRFQIPPL